MTAEIKVLEHVRITAKPSNFGRFKSIYTLPSAFIKSGFYLSA